MNQPGNSLEKLIMVLEGSPSSKIVSGGYRRRLRQVTPFIAIAVRKDGTRERMVGAKCPNQQFVFMKKLDSDDSLCYLRVMQMIGNVYELDDGILADCIMATNHDVCFIKNTARGPNWVRHFDEVLNKVLTCPPYEQPLAQIVAGFKKHNAPLAEHDPSPIEKKECTKPEAPIITAQDNTLGPIPERPLYLPSIQAFNERAVASAA